MYHQPWEAPAVDTARSLQQAFEHYQAARFHDAEVLCRRLLQEQPNNADAWQLLGMLGHQAGQPQAAIELIRRALSLAPDQAGYWNNLATVYHDIGDLDKAAQCLTEALRRRPDYAAAHNNLGEVNKARGRIGDALASYRAALAHQPDLVPARSNYLMTLLYDPDLPIAEVRAEHLRWGRPPASVVLPGPFPNEPDPDRPLRIGYVSPDFRKHAVARFFEPVLEHHDRTQFEVFLYSEHPGGDAVTERLRARAAGFYRTVRRTSAEVAQQVRDDRIDVLIELAGHTRNNRLDVLACKPAPVQVTYLGYPYITGVPEIDYRMTDAVLDPPGSPDGPPERLVRLPGTFACFRPPDAAPAVAPAPSLKSGFITFGSHHPLIKLNDAVLALWRRVLETLPTSRLLFLRDQFTPSARAEFLARMKRLGLPDDRIDLRQSGSDEASYLSFYQHIDIILDCFPFTGHTMTCEALWMGVPVLTLRGDRPAGRLSASVLTKLELPDLIAQTPEEYVQIAAALATAPRRLAQVRADLRERMRQRLCDGSTYTRGLEAAYRQMWRDWCSTFSPLPRFGREGLASPEQLNEQGLALVHAGQPAEAAARFEGALRISPDYPPALNNLGNLLKGAGYFDAAEKLFLRATRLTPDDPGLLNNLGEVYRNQARFPEALAAYQAALPHVGPFHAVWSNYLYALNFIPDWTADAVFEEHRRWGRLAAQGPPAPYANAPDPERRLRIGYVSPYFHAHSGPLFFEPILRHHDPARFEVFLYGQVATPDAVTTRLQGMVAGWRSTVGKSALEVAEQVRADGVDLLVDLAGHSGNGRLDIFALKPAPVQINYLIYPNTTGLEAIDYRITDAVLDPPDQPDRATERLYRMEGGYLCFRALDAAPSMVAPPFLTNGFVTFGSPHLLAKLNDRMLALWARVLDAVPRSRLAFGRSLFAPSEAQRLRQRLREHGIDLERVTIEQLQTGDGKHLGFAAGIDIFLDALPFSGKTTTCEYLWMGVPVVTLRGDRPAGRESAGILTTLGLPELIAESPDEYVRIARDLASSPERLAQLRTGLRERMRQQLCDGAAFTRRLEDAYQQMWRGWCQTHGRRLAGGHVETPQSLNEQGLRLAKADQFEQAAECFSRAIALAPEYTTAHLNLGMSLKNMGLLDEAVAAYQRCIALNPNDPAAYSNLGSAFQEMGRFDEALDAFRRAAALTAPFTYAHHNLLVLLNYHPGWTGQQVFEEHQRWGRAAATPVARTYPNRPEPERKLRIGYVSADFHSHPVSRFFEPILAHHDRERYEVFLYGEVHEADEVTRRLQALAAGWRLTVGQPPEAVAQQVRADGIDILIDLTGHYSGSRLDVLAQQPAPVQATYLGYPNTTGLAAVGWWLTDAVVNPPDVPPLATERIAYIAEGFSCFRPPEGVPEVAPLPARTAGVVTFGSHHALKKMGPEVLALWARVLHAVPSSRMLFLRSSHSPAIAQRLRARFGEHGIAPERILVRRPPRGDVVYLPHFAEIDVLLDTFPFGGHTMTCESLYMGVPVVTLRGDRPCGRLSASVLTSCGLTDLIAATSDEHVAIASRLAGDLDSLERLRGELRGRMRRALCDEAAFTRRFEDVLRRLWQHWCGRDADRPLEGIVHPAQTMPGAGPTLDVPAALVAAAEHFQARRFHDAEVLYRQVLAAAADNAAAWHGLGRIAWAANHPAVAADCFRRALALRPDDALCRDDLDRLTAGGPLFGPAPRAPRADVLLDQGRALADAGRLEEALRLFQDATRRTPGNAAVQAALGGLLRRLGRLGEAIAPLREAARLDPYRAEVHRALAGVYFDLGRSQEAVTAFRQALALAPEHAETHNDLGNALRQLERTEEAAASYRQALRLDPKLFPAHANLGNYLAEEGYTEEGREEYRRAWQINPLPRLRLLYETLLPVLYNSVEEVQSGRARLIERIAAMEADGLRVDPTQEIVPTHFYLAYQGENDRDIHAALGRLGQGPRRLPVRPAPRRGGHKLRIGFLSAYLRNHTIGQLNHGLIARLSRQRFEVVVLSVGAPDAGLGAKIQESADQYLVLPSALGPALKTVADLGLDVLFHTDVGMNAQTYTMGFSRLAPVQVATWGHPVTTGLPDFDYFLSAVGLDAEGAEAHYTEKLIRLPRLGVVYDRPEQPDPKRDRASFGLPQNAHLYVCPQTLFKFHPEFDPLLAEILRRDPAGLLVLLEGRCRHWTEMLQARFQRSMPDVYDRVRFLPKLSRPDFLALLAAADVMLDPIHFGGGNTSYEGLALGTPIVTWPSAYLRGRITYAQYLQMALMDLVVQSAAEYVEKAVRLGTDRDYRETMRRRIAEASGVLYGDVAIVAEFEKAFEAMVAAGPRS